jgi:hypothetical protein
MLNRCRVLRTPVAAAVIPGKPKVAPDRDRVAAGGEAMKWMRPPAVDSNISTSCFTASPLGLAQKCDFIFARALSYGMAQLGHAIEAGSPWLKSYAPFLFSPESQHWD